MKECIFTLEPVTINHPGTGGGGGGEGGRIFGFYPLSQVYAFT